VTVLHTLMLLNTVISKCIYQRLQIEIQVVFKYFQRSHLLSSMFNGLEFKSIPRFLTHSMDPVHELYSKKPQIVPYMYSGREMPCHTCDTAAGGHWCVAS